MGFDPFVTVMKKSLCLSAFRLPRLWKAPTAGLCLLLLTFAFPALAALEQPDQRYLIFMREQNVGLKEGEPETITEESFREVARHFPAFHPDSEILIGMGGIFSYFRYDIAVVEESLRRFLAAAERTEVPVWIKLDGEQWWEARPDLWNWWDPSLPGYDPDNARNVEWTWWSPEHAIKIAWRDWGRQIRVLPPPNLASPEYRRATHEAMERLVPIILEWYEDLPANKKKLFAGLNVGWESGIGTSSYYFPNGNERAGKSAELDPPGGGIVLDDVLSRGMTQIGYAAVSTAGIRTSGDIEERDLVEVVRRHLLDLSRKAVELGVPKEKLYTHAFGNATGEMLYDAAVNEFSNPGWSEYWNSMNIINNEGVRRNLRRPEVKRWGSVEWLLLRPVDNAHYWYTSIKRTLNAPGLKLMCIFNWETCDRPGSAVPRVVNRIISEGLDPQQLPPPEGGEGAATIYEVQEP